MENNPGIRNIRYQLAIQHNYQKIEPSESNGVIGTKLAWRVTIRRIIAYFIDIMALIAICTLILLFAEKYLMPLGENGWWIGLVVFLLYFGILDSSIGKGRTLGKRICGIEVNGTNGRYLSPIDAFLRASVIAINLAILQFWFLENHHSPIISTIYFFGQILGLAIIIFGLFHPQRRSVHDLLLGSIVVRSKKEYVLSTVSSKLPLFILLILGILFGAVHIFETIQTSKDTATASELAIKQMFYSSSLEIDHPQISFLNKSFLLPSTSKKFSMLYLINSFANPLAHHAFSTLWTHEFGAGRTLSIRAHMPGFVDASFPSRVKAVAMHMKSELILSGILPKDLESIDITIYGGVNLGFAHSWAMPLTYFFPIKQNSLPTPAVSTDNGQQIRYKSTHGLSVRKAEQKKAAEKKAAKPGEDPKTKPANPKVK